MAPESTTLLIVHHTVSPALEGMLEAVVAGTRAEGIEGVDVVVRPALSANASDVLAADAFLLGTPANIGYMSGALKHFFDQIYYPTRRATAGAAYGLYVHGNEGLEGAVRSVATVTKGLGWRLAQRPVEVLGEPGKPDLQACWELGAAMASGLMG
ncbi:MAG: NAD(P)H-dependent oxidoreductase [Candidatus Nanopelagicales bacterium]